MECSGTSPSAGSANVVSNAEEEVRSLSNEVRDLKIRVGQQEKIIANLKNQQQNINNRLRAQERYSRKDSLLIVNPPFDANRVQNVTSETLKFFQNYLGVKIQYDAIKACHVVPSTVNNIMPTVICKFLYFEDKTMIYKKRRALRNKENQTNSKNIYLNEPLPECEAAINAEAKRRDLITSTNNCVVSVLVDNGRGKNEFVRVTEIDELDNLNVIKRKKNNCDDEDEFCPAAKKQNKQSQN